MGNLKGLAGKLAGLGVAALLMCAATPQTGSSQGTPKTALRVAYVPVVTWLPTFVAQDMGIFAKHGLEVTLTPIQNLSLLPGTVGRQFDIASSTGPDLIKAVVGGLDVVAVAGAAFEVRGNPTVQVIVRKDSPIKSIKDLKGKSIAAPTLGAVIHVSVLHWAKMNGVDPGDIRGIEVPFPNMGDQLKAGNVDAVEVLEPFAGALLAAGNVSIGDPLLSVGNEVVFPFWIAQGEWARNNRGTIQAWIAALTESRAYMDTHPKEARTVLAKYTKLPEAVVQRVPMPTFRFTLKPEDLGVWVDVLTDLGQISQPVDKRSPASRAVEYRSLFMGRRHFALSETVC